MASAASAPASGLTADSSTSCGPRVRIRTDRWSAFWRIAHTVAEGAVEALYNLRNNALEAISPALTKRAGLDQDLTGQVAIVTGGNAGIGLATAQQLARRGAHVVLACRDRARAEEAVQSITRSLPSSPGATPGRVESLPLDLGRLDSVRDFAAAWCRRGLPLHLLVCNAGVMGPPARLTTADGLEMQFQVNFLSHWLLANLLLGQERGRRRREQQAMGGQKGGAGEGSSPRSGGAAPSRCAASTRVVVVSSVVHRAGPLLWHDMLSKTSYEPFVTYGVSKLANVIMARELQRRIDRHPEYGAGDVVVALHPGMVRTSLASGFFKGYGSGLAEGTLLQPLTGLWRRFIDTAGQALLATTDQAAACMLLACVAPGSQVAGRYMALGRVHGADAVADDPAYAAELWQVATQLTGHTPDPSLA